MNAQTTFPADDRRRDRLIRVKEARERTGLSVATIYRRTESGTFPQKVDIGPRSVGFYESEIDAFVAAPAAYRSRPKPSGS